MNVSMYLDPVIEGCGNGPHRSECTSCRGRVEEVVLAFGMWCLCCFPMMQDSQTGWIRGSGGMPRTISFLDRLYKD
jgi:hypothetical protein